MKVIADLHLHSRFSRATSNKIDIANLEKYARLKGLNLLGTGDFMHPKWQEELKKELTDDGSGIYRTKTGFPFVLQNEISLMYSQGGKGRRVHIVLLAPSFEVVDQITEYFKKFGRVDYDGRPIFGKSLIEVTESLKKISDEIEIIPAHIWTPWFGLLGSKSGFNSFKEAFGDQEKHIYSFETGLSCYDKETDVLTEDGWKNFSEVRYDDGICTLNTNTNEIEFQNPTKIFTYDYKGKMYKLRTKRVDLFVTPNHNLLVSHCDFRKPAKFSLKTAEAAFNTSKRFKKDGVWNGKYLEHFTLPSVDIKHGSRYYSGVRPKQEKRLPMKEWLKFFGFWIAEGWTTIGKQGEYNVCISNQDRDLMSEMKQLLESFGYNVYWDDKVNNTIRVRDYQLFSYLRQFGKASNKFIPKDIKALSRELLQIIFEYYIKGDGHVYGRNGKGLSATTISIRLRDDLQEVALKLGMSAYYKLHYKKGTPFSSPSQGKTYLQNEDSWNIYFIRQNIHTVMPSSIKKWNYIEEWVDFDGKVFCVSVPNKVIYVRRNSIPVWCGNSDPEMNWRLSSLDRYTILSFSDSHSFWPWRIGREATIFDFKNLSYDNLLRAIRTREGYSGTVEVDPSYGKYHFDGHRNCGVSFSPEESKNFNGICPVCGKPLTIGVLYRVEELADRPEGFVPKNPAKFYKLIPLSELISSVHKTAVSSKKSWDIYNKLIKRFDSEFNVLLDADLLELQKVVDPRLASFIIKNRTGEITVKPGYDGVYGEAIFEHSDIPTARKFKQPQKSLLDY